MHAIATTTNSCQTIGCIVSGFVVDGRNLALDLEAGTKKDSLFQDVTRHKASVMHAMATSTNRTKLVVLGKRSGKKDRKIGDGFLPALLDFRLFEVVDGSDPARSHPPVVHC